MLALFASATTCWGEAPSERIKNVLFIISDDLKASVLPAYGNQVCKTPNLDRLAAAGMVFERAYCQGLACAPSRPSFMRSIYPRSKATARTIGEHFQQHDIHTARVGKVFHMPVSHAQLDGSDGKDVAECWSERYNTKSAETFSPGLYRLLNSDIVSREGEGRDAKGPNRMFATVESDQEDGSDQADYNLGEHGFWQKQNLHEEVVRVPLIFSVPGMKPGRTSSLVELVDFYPTCTELLDVPTPEGLQGKSLAPILRDPQAAVRDTALSIHNRAGGGLRSAMWHYMKYGEKDEELYDMIKDPNQYTNVVNDPAYATMLNEARAKFKARMAAAR
jgi:arylsulfatase A-like enzyme